MLEAADIERLLLPFGIALDAGQIDRTTAYLRLLVKWNKAVNLTAVRNETEIVSRHFGESFYLSRVVQLSGRLLDVGSGAGFPGLALKIIFPDVELVLLEPVTKKRAFLKEVVRSLQFEGVEVLGDRVESYAASHEAQFGSAAMRAVGSFSDVLPAIHRALSSAGRVYLWLGGESTGTSGAAKAEIESVFACAQRVPFRSAASAESGAGLNGRAPWPVPRETSGWLNSERGSGVFKGAGRNGTARFSVRTACVPSSIANRTREGL